MLETLERQPTGRVLYTIWLIVTAINTKYDAINCINLHNAVSVKEQPKPPAGPAKDLKPRAAPRRKTPTKG